MFIIYNNFFFVLWKTNTWSIENLAVFSSDHSINFTLAARFNQSERRILPDSTNPNAAYRSKDASFLHFRLARAQAWSLSLAVSFSCF